MKILITGGVHAFAQRIARTLLPAYDVVFGDDTPIPEVLIQSKKYTRIPTFNNQAFSHEMLKLALSDNFEIIIPIKKEEIILLAESKELFAEYGIQIAVPSFQELETIDFIFNPGKELNPTVLVHGQSLHKDKSTVDFGNQSGVCIISDSEEDLLYCCLG